MLNHLFYVNLKSHHKVTLKSCVTKGGVCIPVWITTTVEDGIGIHVAGHLNDTAVREVLLRVCTALQSAGFSVPAKKIVIEVKSKDEHMIATSASNLDLPVALSIIMASEQKDTDRAMRTGYAFVGEHGRYPENADEFNRAVEDGFSDGGLTWTTKDGTVFSCYDEIPC